MSAAAQVRHVVLELSQGDVGAAAMREAVRIAHLLDAELHALFVEDESLLHVAGYPFSREITPLSHQWRPLETERLEAEMRAAADRARRALMKAAGAMGARRPHFEVRRGDIASHIAAICVAGDIVVDAVRGRAGGPAGQAGRFPREGARRASASVLFLPTAAFPGPGPVIALTADAKGPVVEIAQKLAAGAHEALVVISRWSGASADLERLGARLVVTAGEEFTGDAGMRLALALGAPVLVVERSRKAA